MQDALKQALNPENKREAITNNKGHIWLDKESTQIHSIFNYYEQEQDDPEQFRFIKISDPTQHYC